MTNDFTRSNREVLSVRLGWPPGDATRDAVLMWSFTNIPGIEANLWA